MSTAFVDLFSVLFAGFLLFHFTKSVKFCNFYASAGGILFSDCPREKVSAYTNSFVSVIFYELLV